jgi:hypothetical protein
MIQYISKRTAVQLTPIKDFADAPSPATLKTEMKGGETNTWGYDGRRINLVRTSSRVFFPQFVLKTVSRHVTCSLLISPKKKKATMGLPTWRFCLQDAHARSSWITFTCSYGLSVVWSFFNPSFPTLLKLCVLPDHTVSVECLIAHDPAWRWYFGICFPALLFQMSRFLKPWSGVGWFCSNLKDPGTVEGPTTEAVLLHDPDNSFSRTCFFLISAQQDLEENFQYYSTKICLH